MLHVSDGHTSFRLRWILLFLLCCCYGCVRPVVRVEGWPNFLYVYYEMPFTMPNRAKTCQYLYLVQGNTNICYLYLQEILISSFHISFSANRHIRVQCVKRVIIIRNYIQSVQRSVNHCKDTIRRNSYNIQS